MTTLRFLLAAVGALALTVAAQDVPQRYFDLMGEADKAIAEGRLGDAENSLSEAIAMQPGNPANVLLMSNLGMVRFGMGRDSLAVATLDAAHEMAPASTVVLRNRARVLTAMGETGRASADYETLMALDSMAVSPRFYHGMIALRQGDLEVAADDFRRMLEMAPDTLETHVGLAALAMATGDYAEAARRYTAALRKELQPEYYAERALCYLMTDRPGDAADDIARGLELDPMDPMLYLYRAMLNKVRYRPDDAKADGRRAVELGADARQVEMMLR